MERLGIAGVITKPPPRQVEPSIAYNEGETVSRSGLDRYGKLAVHRASVPSGRVDGEATTRKAIAGPGRYGARVEQREAEAQVRENYDKMAKIYPTMSATR